MTFQSNINPGRVITRSKKISSAIWLIISTGLMGVMLTSAVMTTLAVDAAPAYQTDPCPAVNFDYLLLATIWTPTGCVSYDCVDDYIQEWTVHGLWPNYNNGSWPQNCCQKDQFDEDKLSPIREDLNKYWPTFLKGHTFPSFWSHEWSKHGTCSYRNKQLDGELNYFKGALDLFKKYSIPSSLASANIVPGQTYQKADIKNALKSAFGKTIVTTCVHHHNQIGDNEAQLLESIHLCFDKDSLELIDCTNQRDSCPDTVKYPIKEDKYLMD